MANWTMRFNMRLPEWLETPRSEYYRAALDFCEYADHKGCAEILVAEHHQSEDGFISDGLTMAAAIAARTAQTTIIIGALVLPLHEPVQAAERVALVDLISNGRVRVIVGAGYVEREFRMFGLDIADRVRLIEEKLPVFMAALAGEAVLRYGSEVRIAPLPVQKPRPLVLLGGTALAVARRAARLADGFNPIANDPRLEAEYRAECSRLGKAPGPVFGGREIAPVMFLAHDVEDGWRRIAPHLIHEANMYAAWAAAAGTNEHLYRPVSSIEELKALRMHTVMTPDECVEYARRGGQIAVDPIAGGISPDIAWEMMRLLAEKVLPNLGSATA